MLRKVSIKNKRNFTFVLCSNVYGGKLVMLSKKTFSLTYSIMVVLLAIGFILTPVGTAHEKEVELVDGTKIKVNPTHPKPTLSVADAYDVSSAGGAQVVRPADGDSIAISIDFSTLVDVLAEPATNITAAVAANATKFDISDIAITAFDEDGVPVAAPMINAALSASTLTVGNPNNGKNAMLMIPFADGNAANATPADDTAVWAAIDTLYVLVDQDKFLNADPGLNATATAHSKSVRSDALMIELVGAEGGDAKYRKSPYGADDGVDAGTPGVVSIKRLLDRSGFSAIETGAFDVRVILTEKPAGGLTAAMVMVEGGGSATAVAEGLTVDGGTETDGTRNNGDLTLAMTGTYYIPAASPAAGATVDMGAVANLPNATGRDNEYYTYSVTITPNAGTNGDLIISIMQFSDQVKPLARMYVPLTAHQRTEAGLELAQQAQRDSRVMNETLTVRVNTAGDSKVAAATAAYEVRSKDPTGIFNQNPNLKALGKGLVIPANGYLVLASGKTDSDPVSGVVNVDAKSCEKVDSGPEAL